MRVRNIGATFTSWPRKIKGSFVLMYTGHCPKGTRNLPVAECSIYGIIRSAVADRFKSAYSRDFPICLRACVRTRIIILTRILAKTKR